MPYQAADPRSAWYPKLGWTEATGPFRIRVVLSVDQVRVMNALSAVHPEANAYARAAERLLSGYDAPLA